DCVRKDGSDNDAPFGSVYYSMCGLKDGLRACFADGVYRYNALPPEYTMHNSTEARGTDPGKVAGLSATRSGSNVTALAWTAKPNLTASQGNGTGVMRYSVYAIPGSVYTSDAMDSDGSGISAEYLLGMTYTASMEIPAGSRNGFYYAVCCLDRDGHEWAPAYYGEIPVKPVPLETPRLFKPDNGAVLTEETNFVAEYVTDDPSNTELQIFDNAGCTGTPVFTSTVWNEVPEENGKLWLQHVVTPFELGSGRFWWRVKCTRKGVESVTSETRVFTIEGGDKGEGYLTEDGYTQHKDGTTYLVLGLTAGKKADLQSLWIRKDDISPLDAVTAAGDIRDICVRPADSDQSRNIVYLSSKNGGAHLVRLDARTGENVGDITLTFDSQWTEYTYVINGVCVDSKNRLYVHSLAAANANFLMGVVTDLDEIKRTATVKTLLAYKDPSFRFDHARVYGDLMEGTGYIMAVTRSGSSNCAYCWTVKNGKVNTGSKTAKTVSSFVGNVPYIHPVSADRVLVKASSGNKCQIVNLTNGNIEATSSLGSQTTGGVTAFRHGGVWFTVIPARDHSSAARTASGMVWGLCSVSDPRTGFSNETMVTEMPAGDYMGAIKSSSTDYGAPVVYMQTGNGKTSATGVEDPTSTYIYGLCNENGVAAYKLTSHITTGAEDITADNTAGDGGTPEYYNLQGVRMPAGQPLAPGVYIRRTVAGATKVAIR
ncbi:MAG: hypothetical protein ACI30N_01680, partial [Muribaculaceae bacterium]